MKFKIQIGIGKKDPKVEGSLKVKKGSDNYRFLDGWIVEDRSKSEAKDGYFNLINWFFNEEKLTAENDILGYRPLYLYMSSTELVISDNFWEVIGEIDGFNINYEAINQLIHFRRLVPSYRTCIKNVYRLPAGSKLTYSLGDSKPNIRFVKNFKQEPDTSIDDITAADQLHQSFLKNFKSIKDRINEQEIWFGNSGGLDSRLIPAYAQKFDINVKGYLISNKRPKGFLNQSIRSARKVSGYYNFDFFTINFDEGDGWERLLRDLYVNPLGPSNFIKNPAFQKFNGKFILNGGNSFIIANDNDVWRSKMAKDSPIEFFIEEYFFRKKGDERLISDYKDLLLEQVNKIIGEGSDSFSILRTLHQSFLNFTSSAGGFESMNMAGEAQTIHHPFIADKTKKWPEDLFYERRVQTVLFKKYFPELLSIPDQKGLIRDTGKGYTKIRNFYFSKINRFRTNGLDYSNWLKSPWFKKLSKQTNVVVNESKSDMAVNILNKCKEYTPSKDKMNLMKIAVLVAYLEKNKKPIL